MGAYDRAAPDSIDEVLRGVAAAPALPRPSAPPEAIERAGSLPHDRASTGTEAPALVAAEALAAERLHAARAGQPLRLVGSAVWLAILIVAYRIQPSASRRIQIFVMAPYVAGAGVSVLLRNVLRVTFPSHYLTFLWDIPCFCALGIAVSLVDPADATWVFGLSTALCCMGVAGACTTLRPNIVIVVMASALVAMCAVDVAARQPIASLLISLVIITCTAVSGRLLMQRVLALVDRVVEEASSRLRDAAILNEELRHQIADRAGQLASALARLQSPESGRALDPDTVIEGRYRVLRAIGRGGMGAVYEVERTRDGRKLALKVLNRAADPAALARFAREAQLAAQLDHPNVVSVIDVDVSRSGMLFLVMELVAGRSLDRARDRYGDASWSRTVVAQIADALVAMHERGIVHRDLKPSNVLIDGDRVKVTDFGIASVMASGPGEATPDGDTALAPAAPLTRTGHFVGTPLYMAPELASGAGAAGPAVDIFSLGVIAYELFSKQLPFATPLIYERLAGRTSEPPPPLATLAPELSRELAELVDNCCALSPERRPSARSVADSMHRGGS